MNKIAKVYIPAVSIAFTATVLCSVIINLVNGYTLDGFAYYIIQLFVLLVVAEMVDSIMGRLRYKTYVGSFLAESSVLYLLTGIFAYFGHWFGMRIMNIICYSVIYFCIMAGIHYYFYYLSKKEAEDINTYLSKGE